MFFALAQIPGRNPTMQSSPRSLMPQVMTSLQLAGCSKESDSTEVIAGGPVPEGDSDSGSKAAATASSEEDNKREGVNIRKVQVRFY